MYAELFNVSPALEEPASYLQWASYGLAQGATENEDAIRASLGKFWASKADLYPSVPMAEQAQLEKLDALAHGLWGALEQGLAAAAAGNIFGANTEIKARADAARQAYEGGAAASILATQMGTSAISQGAFQGAGSSVAQTEAAAMKDAAAKWNPLGWIGLSGDGPFGIPKVVYALAAAGLAVYLVTKPRRS